MTEMIRTERKFDASFKYEDQYIPRRRHGKIWERSEVEELHKRFKNGESLKYMCEALARPAEGILIKLCAAGYLEKCGDIYYVLKPDLDETPKGNSIMDKDIAIEMKEETIIEARVFIKGVDARQCSNEFIIKTIVETEAEIAKLAGIGTKSVFIEDKIKKLKGALSDLATYLDKRQDS